VLWPRNSYLKDKVSEKSSCIDITWLENWPVRWPYSKWKKKARGKRPWSKASVSLPHKTQLKRLTYELNAIIQYSSAKSSMPVCTMPSRQQQNSDGSKLTRPKPRPSSSPPSILTMIPSHPSLPAIALTACSACAVRGFGALTSSYTVLTCHQTLLPVTHHIHPSALATSPFLMSCSSLRKGVPREMKIEPGTGVNY
jgi:hypothetical protein